MHLGSQIRARRIHLGLTQDDLARRANVSSATVKRIEAPNFGGELFPKTRSALEAALAWPAETVRKIMSDELSPVQVSDLVVAEAPGRRANDSAHAPCDILKLTTELLNDLAGPDQTDAERAAFVALLDLARERMAS